MASLTLPALARQNTPEPSVDALVSEALMTELSEMVSHPVVVSAVRARNVRTYSLSQTEVDELDQAWLREKDGDGAQPYIAAALGSPVSTYLLRQQAQSKGLYNEIFVMDLKGLNVGQSSITSDFWQGDEAKFQKTVPLGKGAIFIDEPEFLEDTGIWVVQVNMTLDDEGEVIGCSTIELNLTELSRRQELGL
ncbi:MAG: hypothetical protein CMK09_10195 [Ponticaulis sp.]|nr:hypothetical protein [Ponticaulis sp.]